MAITRPDDHSSHQADAASTSSGPRADGAWETVSRNVLAPIVNRSGIPQLIANVTRQIPEMKESTGEAGSLKWAAQSTLGALSAIGPYAVFGRLGSGALKTTGRLVDKAITAAGWDMGLQPAIGRVFASESSAQIVGAAFYELLKKPRDGETRVGNAIGTAASFAIFEHGNKWAGVKAKPIENWWGRQAAAATLRVPVGMAGGLYGYALSNDLNSHLGGKDNSTADGALTATLTAGVFNGHLPLAQSAAIRAVDRQFSKASWSRGVPVGRYLDYQEICDAEAVELARHEPLATVKPVKAGETKADVKEGIIFVENGDKAQITEKVVHELKHVRLARQLEASYKQAAELLGTDKEAAHAQFINTRLTAEFLARQPFGTKIAATNIGTLAEVSKIADMPASNGRTYRDNWESEWRVFEQNPRFRPRYEFEPKQVEPPSQSPEHYRLGAHMSMDRVDFAVYANGAHKLETLIFDRPYAKSPTMTVEMKLLGEGAEGVWVASVTGLSPSTLYAYRAHGPWAPEVDGSRFSEKVPLRDPYGVATEGEGTPLAYDANYQGPKERHLVKDNIDKTAEAARSVVLPEFSGFRFNAARPSTAMQDSIIYELSVEGFTKKARMLPPEERGTIAGLTKGLGYLKSLGVTAIETLPIMKRLAGEGQRIDPVSGEQRADVWGYSTTDFFALEPKLFAAKDPAGRILEMQKFVEEAHAHGIEVILDVAFNHTGEGNHYGPNINFRGLANRTFYRTAEGRPDVNVDGATGCGNEVNTNHAVVQQFILDCLKYWRRQFNVDGFRFDLGQTLPRDLRERIRTTSELQDVKLIAEPWSLMGYDVGTYGGPGWAEWNDKFRDTARRWVKGDGDGTISAVAEAVAGFDRLYSASGRGPEASVSFTTAHDGFSLNDLVSYNGKHNESNGEDNRDGRDANNSWNGGFEGPIPKPSDVAQVEEYLRKYWNKDAVDRWRHDLEQLTEAQKLEIELMRSRRMKNLIALQQLSLGTPMMRMGDEAAHTALGDNNTYNNPLDFPDWTHVKKNAPWIWGYGRRDREMFRFTRQIIGLRKEANVARVRASSIIWDGVEPEHVEWHSEDRYLGYRMPIAKRDSFDANPEGQLLVGMNMYWAPLDVKLASPPEGQAWFRRVDTSLPMGRDIVSPPHATSLIANSYRVPERSMFVLRSMRSKQ